MPTDVLALIGAGGHASVVLDAARLERSTRTLMVFSQDPSQAGQQLLGNSIELLNADADLPMFHVAIGDNGVRMRLHQQYARRRRAVTIIHPAAILATSSDVGDGSFVAARAILAPRSRVGEAAIVNHAAILDHDVVVGDFSHVAPGAVLGGAVTVGDGVLVGAGATILPGLTIGDGAIVAAGAVVTRNVSAGSTVVGVPAREKANDA